VALLKQFLEGWLGWLNRLEKKTPRSEKTAWYKVDYHIPPLLSALLTTLLIFAVFCWSADFKIHHYLAVGFLTLLLTGLLGFYVVQEHPDIAKSDDASALLCFLLLATVLWIKALHIFSPQVHWFSPYSTPVALAPLLAALLLNPRLALVLGFVVALILGVVNDFSMEMAFMASVGGVTMAAVAARARTSRHVIRAGFVVGGVQLFMILFIAMMKGWGHHVTFIRISSAFVGGILSSFLGLLALPFLESFFSRTSNLRLLELADVNHPLLRRLSLEAPGTYHHSMIVANLASEAARAMGANPLLCRAGAYFHDIGKIVKSEYFIENQGTYGNPHDQVRPSLSKLVIVSHVKEGIALAKAYNLDPMVLEFIPEHHGTSQIEYFYQKALKLEETEEEVDKEKVAEETYRYPGPKPKTKETGIVMLADSVEASSRTLEEPNHQRYKDLVYKILNKKLFDGQLSDTPLTLKDLHTIADRFVATLVSIHHARIPYPESSSDSNQQDRLAPPK